MKINRIIVAVSIFILIFGAIAISQKLGWWQTKNSGGGNKNIFTNSSLGHEDKEDHEEEEKFEASDEHDDITIDANETHGNTTEVAGSSTIKNALDMGLTRQQIVAVLGEYDDESQLVKDVATTNGLSFGKVKTALNELLN